MIKVDALACFAVIYPESFSVYTYDFRSADESTLTGFGYIDCNKNIRVFILHFILYGVLCEPLSRSKPPKM